MWKVLRTVVVEPLLRRLGTAGATALVIGGDWICHHWDACGLVTDNGAKLVATYCVAVALLCADLAVSWLAKQAWLKKLPQLDLFDRRDLP